MTRRELDVTTRDVLGRSTVDGRVLRLPEQLPRTTYEHVDKALRAMGGKWDRKLRGHVFDFDPSELLAETVDQGSYADPKRDHEQFWTPPELALDMVKRAGLNTRFRGIGPRVLEPSAGSGNIVRPLLDWGCDVDAVEIHAPTAKRLVEQFDRAADRRQLTVHARDFVGWAHRDETPRFDAVVMNPPFSNCQDCDHIRLAHRLVKPGGRLVAVASPHWTFAGDAKSVLFRRWLDELGAKVTELPVGTFAESGTQVGARLIEIAKPGQAAKAPTPKVDDLPLFAVA